LSLPSLRELLSRPLVRLACAVLGVAVLALVVWAAGARAVLAGLGGSLPYLPAVVALEAVMLGCNTLSLRALYGSEAVRVPPRGWLRAATLGYVVGRIVPIGRTAAEAARAVLLRKNVGGPRAAVAAVQMQGVALLANALITVATLAVAFPLIGVGLLSGLLLASAVAGTAAGTSILLVREHARPGRLLGALSRRGRKFGAEFDAAAGASGRHLAEALFWETGSRVGQVVQCAVTLVAVGGVLAARPLFALEGMQLVGGFVGDFIPAQLGAMEATLAAGAAWLGLTAASAAAMALLVHGGQLVLALLCAAVAFGLPAPAQPSAGAVEY
jgi:hypothetical protein